MEYYPNLYNEIFLGNEYLFTAKNDNPYVIDCGSNIGTVRDLFCPNAMME